jgi:LysM repeat protein
MVEHNIPASITLAQGILESANGNSELARYANNHFGIKCHDWNGEKMYKDDDNKDDCFRKYQSAHESFEDHSTFLTGRDRYAFLFNYEVTDYKSWAKGLKKAGYATNPSYPTLLIELIEKHNLSQYDQLHDLATSKNPELKAENTLSKPQTVKVTSAMVNTHSVNVSSNKIKCITVKEGDTFYKISKEFEIGLWQLYKYNDLANDDILKVGDMIYLQPKRNKGSVANHTILKGETMRSISQKYGIKLKKLYKLNDLTFGTNLVPGEVIKLK